MVWGKAVFLQRRAPSFLTYLLRTLSELSVGLGAGDKLQTGHICLHAVTLGRLAGGFLNQTNICVL